MWQLNSTGEQNQKSVQQFTGMFFFWLLLFYFIGTIFNPTFCFNWINNFINDTSRKITPSFIGTNSNLLANNIVELGYSHRFNIQGGIGKLSNAVLNNKEEIIKGFIHHNEDSTIKIGKF